MTIFYAVGILLLACTEIINSQTCLSSEKMCPQGCVSLYYSCDGCYVFEKKCPDGSCIESYKICADLCEYRCPDGTCVTAGWECLKNHHCVDGEYRCTDGSCKRHLSECDLTIDPAVVRCPPGEVLCSDGRCKHTFSHCSKKLFATTYYYYFLIPLVLFMLLVTVTCRYCRKRTQRNRLRRATQRQIYHDLAMPPTSEQQSNLCITSVADDGPVSTGYSPLYLGPSIGTSDLSSASSHPQVTSGPVLPPYTPQAEDVVVTNSTPSTVDIIRSIEDSLHETPPPPEAPPPPYSHVDDGFTCTLAQSVSTASLPPSYEDAIKENQ